MMMDSTFPQNQGMWRAINQPWVHTFSCLSIIAWEVVTMLLCWWGGFAMIRALHAQASTFHLAKRVAIGALTLGLSMWLVAFLSVGAEVVFDVATEDLGWPRVRISHVCRCGSGVVTGVSAGFRPTAVRLWDGGVGFAASPTSEEPQHPGNQVHQIDVR
jgi:Predicted small integral membrane protein (DUF2165)